MNSETVWVFQSGRFASAVFSTVEKASLWIKENKLTGILTEYTIDTPAYSWAVSRGYYKPKPQDTSEFIAGFTSASQNHFHFEDGNLVA